MKKWTNLLFISFTFLLVSCVMNAKPESGENKTAAKGEVIVLDKASFLTKVYNYEKNKNEWVYEGDKPCIIDFYADWCGPCRMIAPIVDELAVEYEGKAVIAKCDVDSSSDVPVKYGIRNIPTILFFKNGELKDKIVGSTTKANIIAKLNALM